ncbi:tetratricopeptide repeat protein [Bacteroides sp. OttesenSCG-928-N06]|nr:tetratricopeptide repeat protein [Bacteroides sp. OttesenSCG-928-N06]
MKPNLLLLIGLLACSVTQSTLAQTHGEFTSPRTLFEESCRLFQQQNYAAAAPLIKKYIGITPNNTESLYQADYMLACIAYELKDVNAICILQEHLEKHPDSPYANRVNALIASAHFFNRHYNDALAYFQSVDPEMLNNRERDDITYRMAIAYFHTGNMDQAAIWFNTLKNTGSKYTLDCTYYISYIRYTQQRYDEALEGFLVLRASEKYKTLAPYYIAEIYLQQKQYDQAMNTARDYLANTSQPGAEYTHEMHRIMGEVYYHRADYAQAIPELNTYVAGTPSPQRHVYYMLGLANYQTGVYSQAVNALGEVTKVNDELTQNANLHLGLSYLQLMEKNKARMAFEQAAAANTNPQIKEQASYNYALCIHETSFSAFGESVNVFERFLNDYPNSQYAAKVSSYLVDVYLNTRSYEAALKSIDRIARPNTQIMEAKQKILFQLGTQTFANANFLKAADYLTQSIALGQYNRQIQADACYWRGEAFYRLNRYNDATNDFTEYLRLNRQTNTDMYALAHYNLGYTAFHRKDYPTARGRFEKFIQLRQGDDKAIQADAYNRIADCYLQNRHFDEAKQYYSLAEALDTPAGDYSFYQLALVAGLQKDYAGKITILNRLAGKYPSSPYVVNALYEKGRAYVQMDNNKQAIASFRELVAKFPESAVSRRASTEIALLQYQNQDYNQAIESYKHVIKTYPGSTEARMAFHDLKSIYIDLDRIDEFASLTRELPGNIQFDVTEQDSLTYVAAEKIYIRGRKDQARESFEKYLQTFPNGAFSLNTHYYLALIAKEQKLTDKVLYHTARLLEYPDNPFSEEALVMQAELQFNQQSYKDAMVSYKMLKEKTSNADRRILAETGILRSAFFLRDDTEIIHAATALLSETKLSPELVTEATYYRAKALLRQKADQAAMKDLRTLAKDTRNLFGAEAKYLVAEQLYTAASYEAAEKELLNFIELSTPHTYWLARGFVLLADTYLAMGKELDARQYLLSLQQNYQADDDIKRMIETRLEKLNNN